MNKLTEKLKKELSAVKLSARERTRMRRRIFNFIAETSKTSPASKPVGKKIVSPYFVRFWRSPAKLAVSSALAVVLVFVGAVSAASYSLPGDILYPIKINFNEPIRGALAFSDKDKIKWNAAAITERLKEIKQLSDQGRLTAETIAEIQPNFDTHVEEAIALNQKVRSENLSLNATTPTATTLSAPTLSATDVSETTAHVQPQDVFGAGKKTADKTISSLENLYSSLRKTLDASSTASFDARIKTAGSLMQTENAATSSAGVLIEKTAGDSETGLLIKTLMDANVEFRKNILPARPKINDNRHKHSDENPSSFNQPNPNEKIKNAAGAAAALDTTNTDASSTQNNFDGAPENTGTVPPENFNTASDSPSLNGRGEQGPTRESSDFLKNFFRNRPDHND